MHLNGTVLVVDDTPGVVRVLAQLLEADGYAVRTATNGEDALAVGAELRPDLYLVDIRLPKGDGFWICRRLKADPATRLTPVMLMTGASAPEDRIRAIEAGADEFLTKPVDVSELKARVRSLVRLKRYTDDLESADAVILALAQTIEARDPYTNGHCQRLAAYAEALGRQLQLPDDDLRALHRGGYLHDLGKIAIPDEILGKPGPLTADEFELVKQHPVIGERLCGNLRSMERVRPIIRSHHERLDGSGYPDGLQGTAVPVLAQIVGIVDVYDAMTTRRPYRSASTSAAAHAELRQEAARGRHDRGLVETFIELTSNSVV